ncbi:MULTISPECIES: four-carbon acid sugar kinase family protein [unclassified Rhizobium]|uniref:four-carbon acid sugar kinase family protein n=1 Tax=unclassified Rhizobium TaxID=2613769 RepID=UPI001784A75D|nr:MULTISPECIES: four-carbon acid sugar kinase family protein [unclassified Rhizobium]MBD8687307.1 four-carbon acid sugar kinase family protein [Rhizobium sp. CFBP 13644]MBD8691761.1 four-carbon acid sugar kinase family protein [Rhizobium sp. CFBP 13717]
MDNNISPLVGIIADDLTSATDGAGAFLLKGYDPLIKALDAADDTAPVISIDTNSRALSASEASRVTGDAAASLANAHFLFKTIDSTLRGHIRQEIAAAFRASGRSRLVIAPAFAEAGRLTIGGIQTVHGIPVSESSYGRDPVHPASSSNIADLVDPSLGKAVVVASDCEPPSNETILILDADSQNALNRQVARIPNPQSVLWVGSPGMAIALSSLVPPVPTQHPAAGEASSRVLIVAGSANAVTHQQCDVLQEHGVPVVTQLADAPVDARVVCLRAPSLLQASAEAVVSDLAAQASSAVARRDFDVVIATGGETMAAILDRLEINRFFLSRELEPGFPVGKTRLRDGAALSIAMKAGGFGSPSTLLDAAKTFLASPLSQGL